MHFGICILVLNSDIYGLKLDCLKQLIKFKGDVIFTVSNGFVIQTYLFKVSNPKIG